MISFSSSSVSSSELPSNILPASKSIHPGFLLQSDVLEEIFIVGTGAPKGVPLPVVNSII